MKNLKIVSLLIAGSVIIIISCKKSNTPPPATVNASPKAQSVSVTGTAQVNAVLTATYTYFDLENDLESGSTYQWYRATDATGSGEMPITGATSLTYTVLADDQSKYVRIGIKPKAATGTLSGEETKSSFVGPIGEATTVTFTYNGQTVTYGIITSPTTGRKWLDRNIGAPNSPASHSDFANYGHLFQWGRGADGHQLISRTGGANTDTTGVSGTTTTLSSTDNPGHSNFIITSGTPNNWRNPSNSNLWQGVTGVNNPCPTGWRLATDTEWTAENLGSISDAYSKLKITFTGNRAASTGGLLQSTIAGHYWTSTPFVTDPNFSIRVSVGTASTSQLYDNRAAGKACKCIKN